VNNPFINYQLPVGNSGKQPIKQLPIGVVDELADELVGEFNNPSFRQWYCGVIYQYGLQKVAEWRRRAADGNEPAKLFSKYVRDARAFERPGGGL
jgi:hypothetical protein